MSTGAKVRVQITDLARADAPILLHVWASCGCYMRVQLDQGAAAVVGAGLILASPDGQRGFHDAMGKAPAESRLAQGQQYLDRALPEVPCDATIASASACRKRADGTLIDVNIVSLPDRVQTIARDGKNNIATTTEVDGGA